MASFITSQVQHFLLIWMFHRKKMNSKTHKINGRTLRLLFKEKSASFEELFTNDDSVSIHQGSFHRVVTEMYFKSRD